MSIPAFERSLLIYTKLPVAIRDLKEGKEGLVGLLYLASLCEASAEPIYHIAGTIGGN